MRRRGIERGALGLGLALSVGLATACEPPPPTPTLTVTTDAAGTDADPGDGTCEATTGAGDCTLQAAVDEGTALGRAAIVVPAADLEYPAVTGEVTGSLSIVSATPDSTEYVRVEGVDLVVHAGAVLTFDDVEPGVGSILVWGSLVLDRSVLVRDPVPLRVFDGASVVLRNTLVYGRIENAGTLLVANSTLANDTGPVLSTTGDGVSHLVGTALLPRAGGPAEPACTGTPPRSQGHNAATDASCGLDQPGDVESETDVELFPGPSSLRVDAIPVGAAGCGTLLVDIRAHPRPADGDGDGDTRCDIGAWERDRPAAP